jgi:ankyrin repeat protein/DNA-binding XRE family transcriptional regulator
VKNELNASGPPNRIKTLRSDLGLLQLDAARLFGVSTATMNRCERADDKSGIEEYKIKMAECVVELLRRTDIDCGKIHEMLTSYKIEIVYLILLTEGLIEGDIIPEIDPRGYLKNALKNPGNFKLSEYEQLVAAAKKLDFDSCTTLIEKGINPNPAENNMQPTPLHFLFYANLDSPLPEGSLENREKTATLLINAGADIKARDALGQVPLTLACGLGCSPTFINFLLDRGAEINYCNPDRFDLTPLMCAVMYGRTAIAKLLIDRGANINLSRKRDGATAMHYAVKHDQLEIFQYMLQHGGDTTTKTSKGDSVEEIIIKKQMNEFKNAVDKNRVR